MTAHCIAVPPCPLIPAHPTRLSRVGSLFRYQAGTRDLDPESWRFPMDSSGEEATRKRPVTRLRYFGTRRVGASLGAAQTQHMPLYLRTFLRLCQVGCSDQTS